MPSSTAISSDLEPGDEEDRGASTRYIAEHGHGPSPDVLASELNSPESLVRKALRRLHDAHALLLHPGSELTWVVHPFAPAPGSCWVETVSRGYWANCLYCAFGIVAATSQDAVVTTRLGGEGETVQYYIRGGALVSTGDVFHLSTPVAHWWDSVMFACSSFQPFHAEADVEGWCRRHALPQGAVLSLPQLWAFAHDWYGGYLNIPWRKRSAAEALALFKRHGLTGPFWQI